MSTFSTTDSPNSSFSLHKLSIDDINPHDKFSSLSAKPKILPIKLLRTKLSDSDQLQEKLTIHGYKYFSKIAAIGNHTSSTLNIIKKTKNLKKLFSFKFDPFNCTSSHIVQLCKSFKNIRGLEDFGLIIRRVNRTNETNLLVPFLSRLYKIRKLFLELIAQHSINEKGHINILKSISKCHSLEYLECKSLNLEQPSNRYKIHKLRTNRHLRRLNELKLLHSIKKGNAKEDLEIPREHKSFRSNHLTKFSLCNLTGDRWSHFGTLRRGDFDFGLISCLTQYPNIQQVNLKFVNHILQPDQLDRAFKSLIQSKNLKSLSFEFVGCQIENEQFFAILNAISQLQQVKHLTLNIFQNPNVSANGLQKFVQVLTQLESYLESFTGYFRRLILPDEIIFQAINEIHKIEKMNCSWSNEALSIKRLQN